MVNIIWSELALEDLSSIYAFISIDSSFYAGRLIDRIIERTDQLIDFPNSVRIVPEFNIETLKELIEGNYRIVYDTANGQVEIVRVHHAA
jgi:plasmid stabilization system protein ParE